VSATVPETIPVPTIPVGLAVTPLVVFLLHCSHCNATAQGEFGDQWYSAKALTNPSSYAIAEETGFEFDVDGRPAVCRKCFGAPDCEECSDEIHAWSPHVHDEEDGTKAHLGCAGDKPEWKNATRVNVAAEDGN
jgi:hypothetical protein